MKIQKLTFILISFISTLLAHGEGEEGEILSDWERLGLIDPLQILYVAILISGIAVFVSLMIKFKKKDKRKGILFWIIAIPIIISTIYLAVTTVYLNVVSETQGPVHWHADFEMYKCGEWIEVVDPEGFSNKVGTPVFHEHNDNRIHVEGVLLEKKDVSLHYFLEVIGGGLDEDELVVKTNDGFVSMKNGQTCNGKEAKLQVFVYRITNAYPDQITDFEYEQIKVGDFEEYILSPYINVPPGDCIIIEFDKEKEKTNHICETYRIAIENGEMKEVK